MNEIKITKMQAAQRQIDVAIWMLFRNDDPLAIHTVAMAGFRILRDLAKKRGLERIIDSIIRPGKETEFWRSFHSFSNFCKHADRDPNDILSGFQEDANESLLLIAATYYERLGCQMTKEMMVLAVWYISLHPNVLSRNVDPTMMALVSEAASGIQSLPRKEQLAIGLTVLKRYGNVF